MKTHDLKHWLAVAMVAIFAPACSRTGHGPGETTRGGNLAPLLKNLGNLQFPITTSSADAQKYFNQGLTLIYGFNHAEALRSFKEVARLDDNCAMAYWGQALALAPNINDSAIGPDREQQGYDAIAEALKRKAKAGPKEQAMIDALAARFSGSAERKRDVLNKSYAQAMGSLQARYPDDADIAVLYADAVMNTMPWNYWTSDGKPHENIDDARIALERALRINIGHPGANHMYIHMMEASSNPDAAVPSADRLGALVPGAGHLVHMPAHTYIRVGRYADAAESNRRAIAADESYISQCRAQGIYPAAYYPHNIHFLNFVVVMQGRAAESLETARKVAACHDNKVLLEPGFGFSHLLKSLPDLTLVRFGRWDEILAEKPIAQENFIFGRAMRHFSRGMAFSAKGMVNEARAELASLRTLAADPSLEKLTIFDVNTVAAVAAVSVPLLEADIATTQKNQSAAIAAFRKAVALEDALKYNEPPEWPLPPRQYYGDALLKFGKAGDAEKIFREDLKRHRDNGWSLTGLEAALRKQGKTGQAAETRALFDKVWAGADVKLTAARL